MDKKKAGEIVLKEKISFYAITVITFIIYYNIFVYLWERTIVPLFGVKSVFDLLGLILLIFFILPLSLLSSHKITRFFLSN